MGAWLRRIRGRGPHGGCCVKHTPGPWVADVYGDVQANGEDVARIPMSYGAERNAADARLIAAAPDLLYALKDCADRLEIHIKHSEDLVAHMKAIAAIAKATGEGE